MWVHHRLFIHPSLDEHLSCFHFGALMNNSAVNIHAQVFMWTLIFILSYLGVELQGHLGTSDVSF